MTLTIEIFIKCPFHCIKSFKMFSYLISFFKS